MSRASAPSLGRRSVRVGASLSRSSSKKISTKTVLIDTAEELFGLLGIDGVSLREIAETAGQSNNNVVQYHFKDKPGLVVAILEDRTTQIEKVRGEEMERRKNDSLSPRELLIIQWRPTMAIRGPNGNHSFCRFLLQFLLAPNFTSLHPVNTYFHTITGEKTAQEQRFPAFIKSHQLLRDYYTHLPESVFNQRMIALSMMFLASVVAYDNARLIYQTAPTLDFDLESILDLALGALSAPSTF